MIRKERKRIFRASVRTALSALLIVVLPASLAVAKLTDAERLEMKKRVQKEIQKGEVPEVKPGMSFEERLYIRKKQQALEKEKQAQPAVPQPPAVPPSPPPKPQEQPERKRHKPDYHTPSYRPFEDRSDRYPSRGSDWREERCRRLWGGAGYEYRRCLDGEEKSLYPELYERKETTIVIEKTPARPRVVPFVDPDGPMNLRAGSYPVWYGAEVSGEAVVTSQDASGNTRNFHLVGVSPGSDPEFTSSCIADNLSEGTVRINEVSSASDYDGADAEAVVFFGNRVLNIQVLAAGCAEFDARTCNDLQLDFCDALQDAESAARRNGAGIWR